MEVNLCVENSELLYWYTVGGKGTSSPIGRCLLFKELVSLLKQNYDELPDDIKVALARELLI